MTCWAALRLLLCQITTFGGCCHSEHPKCLLFDFGCGFGALGWCGGRAGDGAGEGGAVAAATGGGLVFRAPPRASAALGDGLSQHVWAGVAGSPVIWYLFSLVNF